MHHDIAITGGGLAGLSLARQLQLQCPQLSVAVIERQSHPVPVAAHKVGESTVEVGAHYLADTLQLKPYLDAEHLKKFGLRCFFGDNQNIANADEIGSSQSLPVSSYQIDRGLLEAHLFTQVREAGASIYDNARVLTIDLNPDGEAPGGSVRFVHDDAEHTLKARWIVDASGRRGLLKRKLDLARDNTHHGNAVWFRVRERVRIDDWSDDPNWHERVHGSKRWLSTNHFMGPGYWVWIIPLSSGATSIGVVADPRLHALEEFKTLDTTMAWLHQHQPQCAAALNGCDVMDFRFLRDYSYSCADVFSDQQWALTGEAGLFSDPFYSPGTDFIAYGNHFITDLISRQHAGEDTRWRRKLYQDIYFSFYDSTLQLYENQYTGFGNYHLMSVKTVWDYAYYWSVLGVLYFNDALTDVRLLGSQARALAEIRDRHTRLQAAFSDYGMAHPTHEAQSRFTDHSQIPLLYQLNSQLTDRLQGDALESRLSHNLLQLSDLATDVEALLDNGFSTTSSAASKLHWLAPLSQQMAA